MSKSDLMEYCAKAGLPPPIFACTKKGPSHEPMFQASVMVSKVHYTSPPGFSNLRKAEHAAAAAAIEALSKQPVENPESGQCKNSLQEYTQKNDLPMPMYYMAQTGKPHAPMFTCAVEVAGHFYKGAAAKQKKHAEIHAAKVALSDIGRFKRVKIEESP